MTLFVTLFAGAGVASAAFPGANGALLVSGWTANDTGACFTARVPRVVAVVADPDMECDFDSPPPQALFLAAPQGGLVRLGAAIGETRFSPSGGSIVQCGRSGLRVSGAWPGAASRRLGPERYCDATWSPGGTRIIYETSIKRPGGWRDVIAWRRTGGGDPHVLRAGQSPSVSADGRIAYVRDERIRLMDLGGRRPHPLLPTRTRGLTESAPDWAPDGARLAFARMDTRGRRDQRSSIWIAGADGTGLRRVTTWSPTDRAPFRPVWSPDGRWIAFEHGDSVWVVRVAHRRPAGPTGWRRVILHASLVDWQARP